MDKKIKTRTTLRKALNELEKQDIYSLILLTLYKLKEVPGYAILSELVYLLDNDSFMRFFKYYEGQTITIPKIADLMDVINALCFYERKLNTDLTEEEIFKALELKKARKNEILKTLAIIEDLMKEYNLDE